MTEAFDSSHGEQPDTRSSAMLPLHLHGRLRTLAMLGVSLPLLLLAVGAAAVATHPPRRAAVQTRAGVAPAAASSAGSMGTEPQTMATGAVVSASTMRSATHGPTAGPVIYLTASADAQAVAESDLDAAATIRRAFGDSAQLPQVALITSAAGEAQLRQTIAEENQLRSSLSLPEITIVDLRTHTLVASQLWSWLRSTGATPELRDARTIEAH